MTAHIGVILDSAEALAAYRDATGKLPPRMTLLDNTHAICFNADGHAAVLIHQRGFRLKKGEGWDDANGLSVAIVTDDVPFENGRAILEEWIGKMLPPSPDTETHPI